MGKCIRCGKKGLFINVNQSGLCAECSINVNLDNEKYCLETQLASLKNELSDVENFKMNIKAIAINEIANEINVAETTYKSIISKIDEQNEVLRKALAETEKQNKDILSAAKRLQKIKETCKSIQYAVKQSNTSENCILPASLIETAEELIAPTITLKLNCMNLKQLKSSYTQNYRIIKDTLKKYEERYTTKTNKAIYRLMVVALEAELQNVLYDLKYGTLEKSIDNIKTITRKYYSVSVDGSQTIAVTVQKFIGEIEYLFIEAVKIEYEYYTQKQRIKEEQKTLREQMKQEDAERKRLEQERKQVELEESKFISELANINEILKNETESEKIQQLQNRLIELQIQLDKMKSIKEEIIKLQNGRAGYVYIISNIGSFGENVFKVGMTRRLEPMERVNELGDASVPFPFDVHSFIFSDNAVELEHNMHVALNNQRINRINLRREFFNVTIDQIEELVYSIEPTAEFNRTILAEQYNQSLSAIEISQDLADYMFDKTDEVNNTVLEDE